MKKKILSLVLVFALILSAMFAITSCGKDDEDPILNLDEGLNDSKGTGGVTVVTDPTDPEAGADAEDSYVHE